MCTAVSVSQSDRHYFGRTLDLEYHHDEAVTLSPRRFPFSFSDSTAVTEHPAILGMAYVVDGYPLYYDAMNEHGLCMAGLAFGGSCIYAAPDLPQDVHRLAPWELIPYVLANCRTMQEANALLADTVLANIPFSASLPNQPIHWMLADKSASAALETDRNGRIITYSNPADVLTNAPSFPAQLQNLTAYAHLSPYPTAVDDAGTSIRGSGAVGLPGDWSSSSRFVRASFLRRVMDIRAAESLFSLFDCVRVPRGASLTPDGIPIETVYTAVMEPQAFCYRYRMADASAPQSVTPTALQMRGTQCITFPL